jgi:hypothetical protein
MAPASSLHRHTMVLFGSLLFLPSMLHAQVGTTGAVPEDAPSPRVPAVGGNLRSILFYEVGEEPIAADDREHAATFERVRARRIGTELTFDFTAPGHVVKFDVDCTYATPDSTLARFTIPFEVQADWTSARSSIGWGWNAQGNWKATKYTVTCMADGVKVAEGGFEVVNGPPDFPSFNGKLSSMRLFAGGAETPPRDQRKYGTSFVASELQYLNVEIELAHPPAGRTLDIPITCLVIRENGTVAAALDLSFHAVPGDWTASVHSSGWGTATAGSFWKPGNYRMACTGGGHLLGQIPFQIT